MSKCSKTRIFTLVPFLDQFLGFDQWEAHVNCREAARARLADTEAAGTVTAATHQARHHADDQE